MDNIQATPRSDVLGRIADLLKQGKEYANQYQVLPQVPMLGGTGLGDLFMGRAPELMDNISYDGIRGATRGGNLATGGIGTYGARPEVADAALLGMDVAGLGGLAKLGGRAALRKMDKSVEDAVYEAITRQFNLNKMEPKPAATPWPKDTPAQALLPPRELWNTVPREMPKAKPTIEKAQEHINMSRRDFLKKGGAIAGSAALGGGLLRKFGDNVVEDVAPKVVDNVAANTIEPQSLRFDSLNNYIKYVIDFVNDAGEENVGSVSDVLLRRHNLYREAKDVKSGYLREDIPGSVDLSILDELSPKAKQEMSAFKEAVKRTHDSIYGPDDPRFADVWAKELSTVPDPVRYTKDLEEGFKLGYF